MTGSRQTLILCAQTCRNLPPSKLFPLPQERQSGRLLSAVSSRALHYVFHFMSDKESLTQSAGFVSQAELGRADRREKCHRVCSVLSERERIIHYRSSCICADRVDPPQRSMPGQSAYFLPVHKQRWQNEICGVFFFYPDWIAHSSNFLVAYRSHYRQGRPTK